MIGPVSSLAFEAVGLFAVSAIAPSQPGDHDVVDEPDGERNHDRPSEGAVLHDRRYDAAACSGHPPGTTAVGWWLLVPAVYGHVFADPLASLRVASGPGPRTAMPVSQRGWKTSRSAERCRMIQPHGFCSR